MRTDRHVDQLVDQAHLRPPPHHPSRSHHMTEGSYGPRTQEVRRTEAERRLIAAAAEMVGEVGPSKVTLANVGERAGYSRGLATHHFGSKGALMQRLVEAVTHQFRDAMFDQGS